MINLKNKIFKTLAFSPTSILFFGVISCSCFIIEPQYVVLSKDTDNPLIFDGLSDDQSVGIIFTVNNNKHEYVPNVTCSNDQINWKNILNFDESEFTETTTRPITFKNYVEPFSNFKLFITAIAVDGVDFTSNQVDVDVMYDVNNLVDVSIDGANKMVYDDETKRKVTVNFNVNVAQNEFIPVVTCDNPEYDWNEFLDFDTTIFSDSATREVTFKPDLSAFSDFKLFIAAKALDNSYESNQVEIDVKYSEIDVVVSTNTSQSSFIYDSTKDPDEQDTLPINFSVKKDGTYKPKVYAKLEDSELDYDWTQVLIFNDETSFNSDITCTLAFNPNAHWDNNNHFPNFILYIAAENINSDEKASNILQINVGYGVDSLSNLFNTKTSFEFYDFWNYNNSNTVPSPTLIKNYGVYTNPTVYYAGIEPNDLVYISHTNDSYTYRCNEVNGNFYYGTVDLTYETNVKPTLDDLLISMPSNGNMSGFDFADLSVNGKPQEFWWNNINQIIDDIFYVYYNPAPPVNEIPDTWPTYHVTNNGVTTETHWIYGSAFHTLFYGYYPDKSWYTGNLKVTEYDPDEHTIVLHAGGDEWQHYFYADSSIIIKGIDWVNYDSSMIGE